MKRISKALPTLLLLTVLLLLVACKGPVNPSETTTQSTEHEHEYVEEKFPPTCSAEGYSLHFCRLCKDFYIDTPVPMIPHTYTDYVIAPTCSAEGYTSARVEFVGDYTATVNGSALTVTGADYTVLIRCGSHGSPCSLYAVSGKNALSTDISVNARKL